MQKSMKIVFDNGIFALLNHVLTIYTVPLRSVLNSYFYSFTSGENRDIRKRRLSPDFLNVSYMVAE